MQLDLFLGAMNELGNVALMEGRRPRCRPLDRPAPRISIPVFDDPEETDCYEEPERWDGLS